MINQLKPCINWEQSKNLHSNATFVKRSSIATVMLVSKHSINPSKRCVIENSIDVFLNIFQSFMNRLIKVNSNVTYASSLLRGKPLKRIISVFMQTMIQINKYRHTNVKFVALPSSPTVKLVCIHLNGSE